MDIKQHLSNFFHLLGFILVPKKTYTREELIVILTARAQSAALEINNVVLTAEHRDDIWKILNQDEFSHAIEVLDEYSYGITKELCEKPITEFLVEIQKIHNYGCHLDFDSWMQLQGGAQSVLATLKEITEMRIVYIMSEIINEHKNLEENNNQVLLQYGMTTNVIEE